MKKNNKIVKVAPLVLVMVVIASLATFVGMRILTKQFAKNSTKDPIMHFANNSKSGDIKLASASSSDFYYPDLSNDVGAYVLSKKSAPCTDYRNTTLDNRFAFRCKDAKAIWRGFFAKKIDVADYTKAHIEATLEANDYSERFAECDYKGVARDNVVKFAVLPSNPNTKLVSECNHVVDEAFWWEHCLMEEEDISPIVECNLSQCSVSKKCNLDIDVKNRDEIYVLFSVMDDWFADIEGALSNFKVTLTK